MKRTPEITADDYAIYIKLLESKIIDSDEVKPGVVYDYDAEDNIVGIEILDYKNINKNNKIMSKLPRDYKEILDGLVQIFSNPEVQSAIAELREDSSNNNPIVSSGRLYYKGYYAQLKIDLVRMNIYCVLEENDNLDYAFNVETIKEANQRFKDIVDNYLDFLAIAKEKAKEIIAKSEVKTAKEITGEKTLRGTKHFIYNGFTLSYACPDCVYYGKILEHPFQEVGFHADTLEDLKIIFKTIIANHLQYKDSQHPEVLC